jgi:two-component sensor histidine kinase
MLSLKQRIFGIVVVALIPAIGILAINELQVRKERADEVNQSALRQARLASLEVERILDGVKNVLLVASTAKDVLPTDRAVCEPYLAGITRRIPSLNSISVFSPEGARLCGSVAGAPQIDLSKSRLFAEALATPEMQVGEYTVSASTGRPILPVALAFQPANSSSRFILAAGISLDWLGQRLRERGLTNGGQLTLADRQGVIMTRDPFPDRFVGTRIPAAFMSLVAADKPGVIEVKSQDGTERILGYMPLSSAPRGVYVSAGISKSDAFAPINRASAIAVALIVLGAAAAVVLAWLAGRLSIQLPIRRILTVTEAWKGGDLSKRTGLRADTNELAAVGAALDAMADEIEARAEHTLLLSRELTHRVKNTLSVVQVMAGQTFRASSDVDARNSFNGRLQALAGTFDLLTKADWKGSDLRSTIETTVRPHLDPQRRRLTCSGELVELDASLALGIAMIIHELATNAVKYGALSGNAGTVEVSWSSSGDQVTLVWQERDGPPVQPPGAAGFGSRLIQNAIPASYQASVTVDPLPKGIRCTIEFRIRS